MIKHASILILLFLVPVAVFSGGQAEVTTAVPVVDGIVEYFEGDVTVNDVPVEFGMKVPFGATLITGADSYCEVVFGGSNIFRIMESTVAEIKLSVDSPEITIEKGAFAALFTKLTAFTSDEPFKVKTQSTVASIRGTAFFIKAVSPDSTYVCICNGELVVSEPDGLNPANYSSGHHKASWFNNEGGKIKVSSAPLLYHNDEEMESLARNIDEEIPWY